MMAELATPSPERSLDTDAVGLRLGRGLPNLAAFGDKLFVETAARARPQARVLWLNHRWFAEQGLDSLDASTKAQLHDWLIADFAFETAEADSADRTVRADRYGGTGGATHGGSGRCAVVGAFNAKGVGRTPLVPEGVDWTHAHGLLSLDEAVREAISAEIAHAELPYGAVPVIAILDGGGEYWTPEGQSHRRAILVRPNFVRPAYAERSIFFGTSGKLGSDQQIDAERVRDVVRGLTGPRPARLAANLSFDRLEEMFGRFAFQLGYGRAHRLWQGRFLTSNLSIDGALADFGAFRAVPSWRRAVGDAGEIFGGEAAAVGAAAQSLCFYFRKYGEAGETICAPLPLAANVAHLADEAFGLACADALGLHGEVEPALRARTLDALWRYYTILQREEIQVGYSKRVWRKSWLGDAFEPRWTPSAWSASTADLEAARELRGLLEQIAQGRGRRQPVLEFAAARRWLRPRPLLYNELAKRRSKLFVARLGRHAPDVQAKLVSDYIATHVARSRRVWRGLPTTFVLEAQALQDQCAVLYGRDVRTGRPEAWIEATLLPDGVRLFGRRLRFEQLDDEPVVWDGPKARLCVPIDDWRSGAVVEIGGASVTLPPPNYAY